MSIRILWQVSVEDEVVLLGIDRHLMDDLVLLIVQEVLKDLFLLCLVVLVTHYCLSS